MAIVDRSVPWLVSMVLAFVPCSAASAEDHRHCAESLGHHWESAAYLHEIHFQLAMLAVAMCLFVGFRLLLGTRNRKGKGARC